MEYQNFSPKAVTLTFMQGLYCLPPTQTSRNNLLTFQIPLYKATKGINHVSRLIKTITPFFK
jgi:hypothetical protein